MIAAERMRSSLNQSRLQLLLRYDPLTGHFCWRHSGGGHHMDRPAGSLAARVYRAIKIDGRDYLAHRLAWLYVHGQFPPGDIDHINMDRSDNRIMLIRFEHAASRG